MIDFLVIGGGIAGISAGARLSSLGQVTVLEAEAGLGYHTSGRSAAMFDEILGIPTTMEMNRASREYHMTENGGVLSPLGLMLIGTKDDEAAYATEMARMEMEDMAFDDAVAMVPILNLEVVTQTSYNPRAWNIDTDRLIQNFAREIRAHDGRVLTGQRVEKISRTSEGWSVETADAAYEAKILVNAAGSWVDLIAEMAGIAPLGFTPYRRSMARIPAPGGHDVSHWPMLHGTNDAWYARRDAGLLLVSPMDEDPSTPHDAWPEDIVLAEGLARYEAVMNEPVTRLESSWAGLRTFSPDRNLVLGPDATDPAFIWVAGQGGVGFQTSPAASKLIGDLVAGRPSDLSDATVAALSPARFS